LQQLAKVAVPVEIDLEGFETGRSPITQQISGDLGRRAVAASDPAGQM
jgi:hypothetical protein